MQIYVLGVINDIDVGLYLKTLNIIKLYKYMIIWYKDSLHFKVTYLKQYNNLMEVVNQKQYLINEIPATSYGEWPGISSSKWKGSIRIIRPSTSRDFQRKN